MKTKGDISEERDFIRDDAKNYGEMEFKRDGKTHWLRQSNHPKAANLKELFQT